ncbi:MAG: oligosaccharide flippase family protein, partial [Gemmatimonadetes bacterium]|nr:oligosaccharide flippase family protein [Gemmatimonadota bacterium]
MSAVSSVLRNSAVLLSGTIGSKLLVLFSYAVLTRTLGPAGFGRYSLVFAWIAFFEVFTDAGLDSLTAREAARDRESTGRRVGDALILRFLLAAITIPIAAWAFRVFTPEVTFPLAALAGLVLLTSARRASLRSALEVPFRIDLAMGLPTLLAVLAEAVHLGLVAGPLRRLGVEGAVAAQSLSPLPFLILLAIASHRRAAIRLRPDPARLGALARTSLPFVAVLIVNVVLARVDVLMLEYLRDSHEVGVYAAPTRVVEVANLLAILLMTSVFPLFAERRGEEARVERLFRESLRVLVAVVVPVVALQIAFAGPLVRMLFGRDWSASAAVLPWLALSEVLVYADIVITARLLATGRERLNLGLLAGAALANVALNLVL